MTTESCNFFKCLADETRLLSVLLIFKQQKLCVHELVTALGISQPKVSRHLSQLRTYGILIDERCQQWVYYQLNEALLPWQLEVIETTYKANKSTVKLLRNQLKAAKKQAA